jgi:hypothetical protein
MANTGNNESGNRGGDKASHEQHVKAGEQSHKNSTGGNAGGKEQGSGTRGGSSEQHSKAGEQSHKNSK